MKKIISILLTIFFLNISIFHANSFEDKKSEFGVYFGTKIYEERHPVDNSFFMSQDGWMIGINTNSEDYRNGSYFGWKNRLAAGEVNYTSAGTGTMTGIPDYQLESTLYLGMPMEGTNSRTTFFSGIGGRYLLNASGLKLSSTGHSGYYCKKNYYCLN